jgi:hypothetical protein
VSTLREPSWWLVHGLPWPEDATGMAEAAFASSPDATLTLRPQGADGQPVPVSRNLEAVLFAARVVADRTGARAVFLSDVTLWLADRGQNWENLGVDWAAALAEIEQSCGMYVSVSETAHAIICSAARVLTIHSPSGARAVTDTERRLVKEQLAARLAADWPGYIARILANAQSAA